MCEGGGNRGSEGAEENCDGGACTALDSQGNRLNIKII